MSRDLNRESISGAGAGNRRERKQPTRQTTIGASRCATIALVDDDVSVRCALKRVLALAGFAVFPFHSAEEFLAAGDPGGFDCLVLDVQLPGMTGIDLHGRLAALGHDIPIIFISGTVDESTVRTKTRQAAVMLPKPLDIDVLSATLTRTLENRSTARERFT
jgi:FixJ family two-component response regulator